MEELDVLLGDGGRSGVRRRAQHTNRKNGNERGDSLKALYIHEVDARWKEKDGSCGQPRDYRMPQQGQTVRYVTSPATRTIIRNSSTPPCTLVHAHHAFKVWPAMPLRICTSASPTLSP